jgi:hypothetical protein
VDATGIVAGLPNELLELERRNVAGHDSSRCGKRIAVMNSNLTSTPVATMVEAPYVNHVPTMTGGVGHDEVKRFTSITSSAPARPTRSSSW